jgi:hypothetical protein
VSAVPKDDPAALLAELAEAGKASTGLGVAAAIARINAQYALLDDRGSLSIWNTQPGETGSYSVYRPQDFEKKLANQYVTMQNADGNPVQKPLGAFWMKHPDRRDLNGVGFWPEGKEPPGTLNLWRGFGCEPKKAKWTTLRRHLLEVICGGDKRVCDYLLRLLAWKVQNPTTRPEIAIIMRSDEGTGKGTFVRIIERWFGEAYRHVGDAAHVLGDFNDVLIGALTVFMDEALFAHDPRQVKRFMGLVTEERLTLNGKFKPAFSWHNPVLWIVATNNRKAIDASNTARRYLMLEVSDRYVGDVAYFKALHAAIDGDEAQGMLHDLRKLDLEGWHPRESLPKTEALTQQKMVSLKGPAAFMHEVLEKGDAGLLHPGGVTTAMVDCPDPTMRTLFTTGQLSAVVWEKQRISLNPADLFDAYRKWSNAQRGMHGQVENYRHALQVLGELLPRSIREAGKGATHNRYWLVPLLGECREHFDLWLAGKLDRPGSTSRRYRGK